MGTSYLPWSEKLSTHSYSERQACIYHNVNLDNLN